MRKPIRINKTLKKPELSKQRGQVPSQKKQIIWECLWNPWCSSPKSVGLTSAVLTHLMEYDQEIQRGKDGFDSVSTPKKR